MTIEPKPIIGTQKAWAIGIVFLIGMIVVGAGVYYSHAHPTHLKGKLTSATTNPTGAIANTSPWAADGDFELESNWGAAFLNALGLAVMTVCLVEVFTLLIQRIAWKRVHGAKLDEFFGDETSKRSHDCIVQLQGDSISDLLTAYAPHLVPQLDRRPPERTFKARDWINRWDMKGARAILSEFRDRGLKPPYLHTIGRNIAADTSSVKDKNPPFHMFFGLGFSEGGSGLINSVGDGWVRFVKDDHFGDLIELRRQFVTEDSVKQLSCVPTQDGNWFRVVPKDWSLETWCTHDNSVNDYAIILRHTDINSDGSRKAVTFVVAGFTERGTAAAGHYLAENWPKLWRRFVKNQSKGSFGDFMIFISGKSHNDELNKWREDPALPAITPDVLNSKQYNNAVWVKRLHTASK